MWLQRTIHLPSFARGFHLVTDLVLEQMPEIKKTKTGLLTLLLQHTSASLSLNENADPTVRLDMETIFNKLIPEDMPFYQHTFEGPDDLPAHLKSALIGVNLVIPIKNGKLSLGTWQGIVLGEHRNHAGSRVISALLQSE
jgi:secondary thiamine-phosphate synthase enzyme